MPIRMVDDPNDQFDNSGQDRGGGGRSSGGGGGIFQLLPLLFGFIKNPIGLVLVLLVGGFLYFKDGCSGLINQASTDFATGGVLDPREFDKAQVYEGLDGCQGSYIIRAMENMTKVGAVPLDQFPYDETDCSRDPSALKNQASQYRILGFTRLTNGESVKNIDLYAIKQHLAKDVPVVIGMMVGGSFMEDMLGQQVWHPRDDDYSMMGFGGHAMCVIGYDDRKEGGAFQILNSWGPEWGQNGVGWIRYNDFKHFTKEAYGLNPMPLRGSAAAQDLECSIGLVENKTKQYIPLQLKGSNTFQTTSPITRGTEFKMEVKNSSACYVYVLGMETDGSSYILFPYPMQSDPSRTKFSPYCGITGYRLFPRGMSMMADNIGNKDYMAVIVSKDSLNVFRLNESVNNRRSSSFAQSVNAAISENAIAGVRFSNASNGTMNFKTTSGDKVAVVCVVEIDKQ